MISILLVIIYLAFISLGLPDSLLGAARPVMRAELEFPVSYAGIITMIISGKTILPSLASDRITKKFGTGIVIDKCADDCRRNVRIFCFESYAAALYFCRPVLARCSIGQLPLGCF